MLSIKKFADVKDDNNVMEDGDHSYMENDYNFKSDKKPTLHHDLDKKDIHPANLYSDVDNVIIPNEFQYGIPEVQTKGVKNTFYCSVCHVELSSQETKRSHANGSKHQKKMLALKNDREEKIRKGLMSEHEEMPGIRPIPNPESIKVKIPIRLQQRIKETEEPVVGLKYIKEYLTKSDPEMEPHYECDLCGSKGTSNSMFSHLMGHHHRKEFAETKGFRQYVSQKHLLQFASKNAENDRNLTELIKTTVSDVAYPAWPAGKAPWSVEKGGNGIPPAVPGAGAKSSLKELVNKNVGVKLELPPDDLTAETQAEADHMIAVGKQMMEMALRSPHSGVSQKDQDMMMTTLNSILKKIQK